MTKQDKQALIKHFCERDCGEAAKDCTIMPCHEIELIQEFQTTEPDSDTISRQAAIDAVMECYDNDELFEVYENKLNSLPPAQPERIKSKWVLHTYMPHNKFCLACRNDSPYNKRWDFCPNCGAYMREVTT